MRGVQVIFDSDLMILYGVETGNLNKAVSGNAKRFPNESASSPLPTNGLHLLFQIGSAKPEARQ
ncbi:ORF6N domain-containing protein [Adlercreutzia sp. ZJ138]|uniref:ORF6N domain-containing protein n=1 Tax=Adlercreutzia sp. ZJ138 TaxID=2709405 RepID=UPI00351B19FE